MNPTCHVDRPHYARGLCSACYQRAHRKQWSPKIPATCHPDRAHKCRGLCSACYQKEKAKTGWSLRGRKARTNVCGHADKPHAGRGMCGACLTRDARDRDRNGDRIKRKDYQLRATYGITLAEFHARYEAQGSVCALCRKAVPVERNRHVDHCHDTGRIRGILCFDCNKGLGLLGDSPESIKRALDYVSAQAGVFVPVAA